MRIWLIHNESSITSCKIWADLLGYTARAWRDCFQGGKNSFSRIYFLLHTTFFMYLVISILEAVYHNYELVFKLTNVIDSFAMKLTELI
jgi:hypothetical protein